jgi:hypothetical protein
MNGAQWSTCPALKELTKSLVTDSTAWKRATDSTANQEFLKMISSEAGFPVGLNSTLLDVHDHIKGILRHGHKELLPADLQTEYAVRNIEKLVEFMHKRAYQPRKIAGLVGGPLLGHAFAQLERTRDEYCARTTALPSIATGKNTRNLVALACDTPLADVEGALFKSTIPVDARQAGAVVGPRLTVYVGDDPTLTALLSVLGLLGADDVGWFPDYSDRLIIELWGPADAGAPTLSALLTR